MLGDIYDGMRIRYVVEEEPLGTAGPVRLAYDEGLLDERLLVLNGDVLTDLDLTAEIEQHERTGARATLALVPVDDTSSYGVVPTDAEGRVEAFLEKGEPAEAPTNLINAGAYVLERDVVETIPPGRAVSFEREIFPELVGAGLYGYAGRRLLDRHRDARALPRGDLRPAGRDRRERAAAARRHRLADLRGLRYRRRPHRPADGARAPLLGRVRRDGGALGAPRRRAGGPRLPRARGVLAEGVRVERGARVGPGAIVGAGAVIGAGAVVEEGARIAPDEQVDGVPA